MSAVDLHAVLAARDRIRTYVRHTPMVVAWPTKEVLGGNVVPRLKLECLQVTGSFKARGAVNKLLTLSPEEIRRGIVTASGGNHGLGVAYAGSLSGTAVTIYLPRNTPSVKAEKLRKWGARVVFEGEVWDEANEAALLAAQEGGLTYFHPFADPAVIAGQGTVGLEILEDAPDTDVLLVAIGGGGLISGVGAAAKAIKPAIRIIGVEPVGAPTLYESLRAGQLIELREIATEATTLAPRMSSAINLDLVGKYVDDIVLVSDDEMRKAARWLWFEMGVAAELSGAAAMAALLSEKVEMSKLGRTCVLVCGAGRDGVH